MLRPLGNLDRVGITSYNSAYSASRPRNGNITPGSSFRRTVSAEEQGPILPKRDLKARSQIKFIAGLDEDTNIVSKVGFKTVKSEDLLKSTRWRELQEK
jgi:hypothetical protein